MQAVSSLDNVFRNANIINNNTFNNLKSKRDNLNIVNEKLNNIIDKCREIVYMKESKNPNLLLSFIKDNKIKKTIVSITFDNSITENKDDYWFVYEYIYMILFRSDIINLKEISDKDFYRKNIDKVYEFVKRGNKDMKNKLFKKFCGNSGNLSINKIREHLKKEYNSYIDIPVDAKICEEKFGSTKLTKDCIESQLCDILIKKDAINTINTSNFETIIGKILHNIRLYYSYLGNQASFTLQFIQYILNEQIEKTTNNRQMQNLSSKISLIKPQPFNIPSELQNEFIKIVQDQMRQLGEQYGGSEINKYLHKMYNLPQKEFNMLINRVGKKNAINFLNIYSDKNIVKKILERIRT